MLTSVAVLDGDDPARGDALARALQLPFLVDRTLADARQRAPGLLLLTWRQGRLQLEPADRRCGPIAVDFGGGASRHRLQGGAELVVRAVRGRNREPLRVVDATAGLGRDAFVLASRGLQVLMIERSPIIVALLADGLARAQCAGDPAVGAAGVRLSLHGGDAVSLLESCRRGEALPNHPAADMSQQRTIGGDLDQSMANHGLRPDVVYLDPMFPEERKSALAKKEMQLFQQLLSPADDTRDERALLDAARHCATRRVVVKRPLKGPVLAGLPPGYTLRGKAVRFDVYVTGGQMAGENADSAD